MAYVARTPEQEKELAEQGQPASQQPPVLGGDQGLIQGTPSAPPPSPEQKPASGTWTNLNQYLEANRPQAAALGGQVAGQVDEAAKEVDKQVTVTEPFNPPAGAEPVVTGQPVMPPTIADQFNDDLKKGTVTYDPNLVADMQKDPVAFSKDPTKMEAWRKMMAGEFTGPGGFNANDSGYLWSNLQGYIDKAQDIASATQSASGRKQLLQDDIQKSKSLGVTSLNNAFLQGSAEGQAAMKTAKDRVFNEETGSAATANKWVQDMANPAAEAAKKASEEAATKSKAELDALREQFETDLQTGYETQLDTDRAAIDKAAQEKAIYDARREHNKKRATTKSEMKEFLANPGFQRYDSETGRIYSGGTVGKDGSKGGVWSDISYYDPATGKLRPINDIMAQWDRLNAFDPSKVKYDKLTDEEAAALYMRDQHASQAQVDEEAAFAALYGDLYGTEEHMPYITDPTQAGTADEAVQTILDTYRVPKFRRR